MRIRAIPIYDYAAQQPAILILGFQNRPYICARDEIVKRNERTGGQSKLYGPALELMDKAASTARYIFDYICKQNQSLPKSGRRPRSGLQFDRDPLFTANDIAYPAIISGDGSNIYGSSTFSSLSGTIEEIPGRPFRRGTITVGWPDSFFLGLH